MITTADGPRPGCPDSPGINIVSDIPPSPNLDDAVESAVAMILKPADGSWRLRPEDGAFPNARTIDLEGGGWIILERSPGRQWQIGPFVVCGRPVQTATSVSFGN
jgi:hypothetical protein